MKQITIYELLPLLKKGWVAYDKNYGWCWFDNKPSAGNYEWLWVGKIRFLDMLKPKRYQGDWKDSLRRIK